MYTIYIITMSFYILPKNSFLIHKHITYTANDSCPEPAEPEVTKMEFDMKDRMIRQTIMTTQEDVTEIKEDIKYLRDKIDKMQ